ncbi:hypothetical protein WJX81_007477 [Elliptochloris bilobata]|uniref:AMP-dependent synthetase n=1 Tax=Elliptochloris bilobata TaxID=381761 RepID=A0AAW1QKM4_9CHLO
MLSTSLRDLRLPALLDTGISRKQAAKVLGELRHILESDAGSDSCQVWQRVSKEVLQPDDPFALHQLLYKATYHAWQPTQQGPPPAWLPTADSVADTNLAAFMQTFQGPAEWERGRTGDPAHDLPLLHRVSCQDSEAFWGAVLRRLRIRFARDPDRVLEQADNPDESRWLPGARLNAAEAALSARDPDAPALIWASEAAPAVLRCLSRGAVRRRALRVAAALRAAGHAPGARIAMNGPMTAEAVVAYLGVVLAGCAVVGIADSFSAAEVASRLRISEASAIITQDVILRGGRQHPLFARVADARAPPAIVMPAQPARGVQVALRPGDVSWTDFLAAGEEAAARGFEPHIADPDDATNILFSSGTTGEPKAIPWTHVTPLRCAADSWAHLDLHPRDVLAWPTSLGWMMGPFVIYGALMTGAALAVFQGSPLERPFGEFVAAARVTQLGVVPALVRVWRGSGCMQGLDWSALRCFASTGETSVPDDSLWLMARAGYRPVMEVCGGTELAGGYMASTLLQPQSPSTFSQPAFGTRLVLLGPGGEQSAHGPQARPFTGEIALAPPLLGASQRLLNRDHFAVYYEGMPRAEGGGRRLRRHGDEVERLPGGYYRALGRCDDTMNLGGIKVSSVELERSVAEGVPGVAEVAAVGVPRQGGGPERLVLHVVLEAGARVHPGPAALLKACQAAIRERLNPLFRVDRVVLRESLPRTASNKVIRRLLRDEPPAAKL